ncbi:sensor histidine kinase [Tepidimicrobium xylanilyticum]|uniref:histidine kinase n=2 Tax=Tepidimicrobium xylanilyticum TaxID=1123352 RepID=A0A1H3ARQ1_9FIRM|nr:HAMP domain-containing sensor histidine kinase [Tepidimicrobium xylanilyticum]GMG97633.1 sensor histidine kinase [Tepidimicrobium xylanilyticum]SDX32081.1 Signal transduction histidine kinase [Tepidimicrobium xylanilyticum]
MLVIYSLIIILAFTSFSILVLNNYKNTQIKNIEISLFQTANIVADTYKRYMENIVSARIMVKSYGKQASSRILVLNSDREVLIDNLNTYLGKTINNEEVRSSLQGQSKSGLYSLNGREILQISVPIISKNIDEDRIVGAVLISASLDSIHKDIEGLKRNMIKISASALALSLILTIIATNNMTKPLKELSYGVEKIFSGDLGYTVKNEYKGEMGRLIEVFNRMSNRLSNIEKSRKNFINTISHELKTPLTSIKVLIESLSIGENSLEIYKEYLDDVYKEAERMEGLVNNLMKSIKLEDMVLNVKEENLGQILSSTIKPILPYAEKNKVKVIFHSIEETIVKCDKDRLKEALLNLLDNAIKYRDEAKEDSFVSITGIKLQDKILITIEDNGIGIDRKSLPNIFQSGFRILEDNSQNGYNIEGYGIGLALVKNIIDKHNWEIVVKSTPKLGSLFTIVIPLH